MRATGVQVTRINLEKLAALRGNVAADLFYDTGVIYNPENFMRTINSEGVADRGTDQGEFTGKYAVYTWTGSWVLFTREEIESCLSEEKADLSEFVRTFGARLESNFYVNYRWAIVPGEGR